MWNLTLASYEIKGGLWISKMGQQIKIGQKMAKLLPPNQDFSGFWFIRSKIKLFLPKTSAGRISGSICRKKMILLHTELIWQLSFQWHAMYNQYQLRYSHLKMYTNRWTTVYIKAKWKQGYTANRAIKASKRSSKENTSKAFKANKARQRKCNNVAPIIQQRSHFRNYRITPFSINWNLTLSYFIAHSLYVPPPCPPYPQKTCPHAQNMHIKFENCHSITIPYCFFGNLFSSLNITLNTFILC